MTDVICTSVTITVSKNLCNVYQLENVEGDAKEELLATGSQLSPLHL